MEGISILCNKCNKKTEKILIAKDGFKLRSWQCPSCKKIWHNPSDFQDYQNFLKIKNKNFQVKLRIVGNSYTVSIPKEIISFEEEFQREIHEIINMTLEEPKKLSLYFSKKIRKSLLNTD